MRGRAWASLGRARRRRRLGAAIGKSISGTWKATYGSWHATYIAFGFVHQIEGRITTTEDGGEPVTLAPGDVFVVEAGFKGGWRIEEPVRKHFAIRLR